MKVVESCRNSPVAELSQIYVLDINSKDLHALQNQDKAALYFPPL